MDCYLLPKNERTNLFFACFLIFMANKSNSSLCFLGESKTRQSAFRFYLTFNMQSYIKDSLPSFSVIVPNISVIFCFLLFFPLSIVSSLAKTASILVTMDPMDFSILSTLFSNLKKSKIYFKNPWLMLKVQ